MLTNKLQYLNGVGHGGGEGGREEVGSGALQHPQGAREYDVVCVYCGVGEHYNTGLGSRDATSGT